MKLDPIPELVFQHAEFGGCTPGFPMIIGVRAQRQDGGMHPGDLFVLGGHTQAPEGQGNEEANQSLSTPIGKIAFVRAQKVK